MKTTNLFLSLALALPLYACGSDASDEDINGSWDKLTPRVCEYDGKSYKVGDSFPAADGCNSCACNEDGSVVCTLVDCERVTCEYNGKSYEVGDSFPAADGCNSCACNEDGSVVCTLVDCERIACEYNGKFYEVGASFPAADGCNSCACNEDGS
ncbi:MAG TPA: hypothetical protein PKK83_24090, partial [Polyangiaceae bacterium]|nr:hypothetical protein [Polyangiaceae bacterium]